MSTETVVKNLSSDLVAHVPVDEFTIVDGPGAIRCMNALDRLLKSRGYGVGIPRYEEVTFTLKTAASNSPFKRRLLLASITELSNDEFNFTAIFCGRVVSGVYQMSTRVGWFSLD